MMTSTTTREIVAPFQLMGPMRLALIPQTIYPIDPQHQRKFHNQSSSPHLA